MVTEKRATRTPVESVRHARTHVNIPAEELREVVTDKEALALSVQRQSTRQ